MAKKHTYKVPFNGQTFTRTTARTYTHVIIGKADKERAIQQATKQAAWDASVNHKYYVREAGPDAIHEHSAAEMEVIREKAALTIDEYEQRMLARALKQIAEQEARGYYRDYIALAWAGRPDLAIKECNSCEKYGWINVQAIEVPQLG